MRTAIVVDDVMQMGTVGIEGGMSIDDSHGHDAQGIEDWYGKDADYDGDMADALMDAFHPEGTGVVAEYLDDIPAHEGA